MPVGTTFELRGFEAGIEIEGTLFHVVEGEPNEDIETARSDTTATGEYKGNVPAKREFQLTLKAIRYSNLNPHATPYFIARADVASTTTYRASIKYWPNKNDIGDDTKAWRATMVWSQYSEQFNAQQGLITLNAKGISTGTYRRPGDA